jgi:hypothetical protein
MMRTLLLTTAAALAFVPLAAGAQGVPTAVTAETLRALGTLNADALRSNEELIQREQSQASPATPEVSAQQPQPQPQPRPQPDSAATTAPR